MFGHRDFRLLWIGETTSSLGANISRLTAPIIAVGTLRADTFTVSVLAAMGWLPWLVIGLPAGAWVDRLARRPLMIVCNLVSASVLLTVPVAVLAGALTIGHLLVVTVLTGTATVFFQTAYQVYLPSVVNAADFPAANSALQGSESVTRIAGPSLAGLLTQVAGAVTGLVADAASFLVSTACLVFNRAEDRPSGDADRTRALRREISEGLRFVAADPYLRVLTVFGATSNLVLTGQSTILIVFLTREMNLGPATVGLLVSGTSVGGALGAAGAGFLARRLGTARALLFAELGAAPFALLTPMAGRGAGLLCVLVGGAGVGAGIVIGNVLKNSFRQTYTPRHLQGRVLVTMQFLNYGTIPLGTVLSGVLGTTLGLRPTLWVTAAGLVLASLVLLTGPIRRHRDLPTSEAHHGQ
ncbi:MFS transporter [Amycolatopsis minnesotensis]|uniref:MFS transporter n=1 Tax=Amycolatopsis minnesotensis TaxID=337894 RepID=A0ABN2S353_9PSEU